VEAFILWLNSFRLIDRVKGQVCWFSFVHSFQYELFSYAIHMHWLISLLLDFLYFSIVGTANGQFPYYPVTLLCLIPQCISSNFFILL